MRLVLPRPVTVDTPLISVSSLQFNFFNCFASLFYIAFIMQDMVLLRQVGLLVLPPSVVSSWLHRVLLSL